MKIGLKPHIKLKNKISTYVKLDSKDKEGLELIQSFSRSYYHVNIKQWELPQDAFRIILSNYQGNVEIVGKLPTQEENFLKLLDLYDEDNMEYESNTKPFIHQIDSFNYSLTHNKFLLGDQQGLGKTKQALDIAWSKRNKTGHCLIVCGVNGLKYNWMHEISVHTNGTGYILGTNYRKSGNTYIGNTDDKLKDLQSLHLNNNYFIITNIESLRDKNIQKELKKLTLENVIGITIIDEIHKCKNSTSNQGKAIHCLQSYYKIALTGTPLMNNAIDLYNILKWLEVENHTLAQFKSHYCIMGGFGGYEIIGYRNTNELQNKLNSIMLRRLKNDVLDLPPKLYTDEYLEMNDKQAKIYHDVHANIMDDINRILLLPNPLVELTRLRQATSYPGILSTTITDSAKLDRLLEIVYEVQQRNGRCIIFSNWTSVIEPAYLMLKENDIHSILISGKSKNPEQLIHQFKTDSKYTAILGTIGILGTGFTLTEADTIIFLDEPWNKATKEQAEDRAHRIGTKGTVNIITLMCKDTIDEKIHELIQQKGELSDKLVDNKDIIRYLLDWRD